MNLKMELTIVQLIWDRFIFTYDKLHIMSNQNTGVMCFLQVVQDKML